MSLDITITTTTTTRHNDNDQFSGKPVSVSRSCLVPRVCELAPSMSSNHSQMSQTLFSLLLKESAALVTDADLHLAHLRQEIHFSKPAAKSRLSLTRLHPYRVGFP